MPNAKPLSPEPGAKGSLLSRLRASETGNVMAMTAAAIIPLIAMIGGAVDISRIYLTKTRLQQACDAAVLAGRKSMTGLDWRSENEQSANQFFRMNFPEGKYGTAESSIEFTDSGTGSVSGEATATVPMTLMALFDFGQTNLSATCTADMQLPNTDVMMVLDTTLSMSSTNPGDTKSRIEIMREAVSNFHSALESVKLPDSQIRYGFVPYSSTVNVGMLLRPEWIQDNPVYSSRVPDGTFTVPGEIGEAPRSYTEPISGKPVPGETTYGDPEDCKAPPRTLVVTYTSQWSAWDPSAKALPRSRFRTRVLNGVTYSANINSRGQCEIKSTIYENVNEREVQIIDLRTTPEREVPHWIYEPVSYSMASLKQTDASGALKGGSFTAPIWHNHTDRVISWTVKRLH